MWINVEDKLPPLNTEVLVVHDKSMVNPNNEVGKNAPKNPIVTAGYLSKNNAKEYWVALCDSYMGCIFNDKEGWEVHGKITHWQPYPPLPNVARQEAINKILERAKRLSW